MDKAKKFKLNVMKAFHEDENRKLHKDILGALIEDELTPDMPLQAVESRDVSAPALEAKEKLALPEAKKEEPKKQEHTVIPLSELSPKPAQKKK